MLWNISHTENCVPATFDKISLYTICLWNKNLSMYKYVILSIILSTWDISKIYNEWLKVLAHRTFSNLVMNVCSKWSWDHLKAGFVGVSSVTVCQLIFSYTGSSRKNVGNFQDFLTQSFLVRFDFFTAFLEMSKPALSFWKHSRPHFTMTNGPKRPQKLAAAPSVMVPLYNSETTFFWLNGHCYCIVLNLSVVGVNRKVSKRLKHEKN